MTQTSIQSVAHEIHFTRRGAFADGPGFDMPGTYAVDDTGQVHCMNPNLCILERVDRAEVAHFLHDVRRQPTGRVWIVREP